MRPPDSWYKATHNIFYNPNIGIPPGCRNTCQQQCTAPVGPGGRTTLGPCRTAGWTGTSESWVWWRQDTPCSPPMGVFLQASESSTGPAEKRCVKLHRSQSTLPGVHSLLTTLEASMRHLSHNMLTCSYFSSRSQLEAGSLDTSLVLHLEDERMVDILFNFGSKNRTAIIVVSLWQQIQQLKGVIPTSLQVHLWITVFIHLIFNGILWDCNKLYTDNWLYMPVFCYQVESSISSNSKVKSLWVWKLEQHL